MIPISPDLVIAKRSYRYPSGLGAELFCRLIDTEYFLFVFGKASLLSATCMAVDRWFAVTRPLYYQRAFSRKALTVYLTCICCVSVLLPLFKPIQYAHYLKDSRYRCSKRGHLDASTEKIWSTTYVAASAILPCIVTWVAFLDIWRHTRLSADLTQNARRELIREKLLRLASATAVLMTLCWLPIEVSYMLYPFKILPYCRVCFKVSKVLALGNSVFNPILYFAFNKVFREEIARLFSCMCQWKFRFKPTPNPQQPFHLSSYSTTNL